MACIIFRSSATLFIRLNKDKTAKAKLLVKLSSGQDAPFWMIKGQEIVALMLH